MSFIIGILTGALAGYIASKLQRGNSSGFLINLFLGVIGSVVGTWLFGLFGLSSYGWLGDLIVSVVGAVIVLWVFAKLKS
ncbi:MAG: GlsB/YeaQ/YmgE family stress response membrane protein [Bacteroidaceae bacterium]|nr:GlsB/YeaQ/YmgE family stress response membrane protein [Bacteroidaceae bacterium]